MTQAHSSTPPASDKTDSECWRLRTFSRMSGDAAVVAEALARVFGSGPARLVAIHPGYVYRVERDGRPWVVRWFPRERPVERVAGDAEVLHAVRNLPVEQLVETIDGDRFVVLDGRGVLVTEFIHGPTADTRPTTVGELAWTLAAVSQVTVAPASVVARRAGSLPAEDLASARRWLAEIEHAVPTDLRAAFSDLRRDVDQTNACEAAPVGLLHPDCHLGNAIVRSDGTPVLVDWAGAGLGPLIASLGWLLFTAAVAGPERDHSAIDRTAVAAVMSGYTELRALGQAEFEVLRDAVRFRPLAVACRQLRDAVRTGDRRLASGWWSRYSAADEIADLASLAR